MLPKEIKNVADIEQFFEHLYEVEDVAFHPDDKFEGYGKMVDGIWVRLYSKSECEVRNELMRQAFQICDPSEVALAVARRLGIIQWKE